MSGLRSKLLWRGSFDKFPSVPLYFSTSPQEKSTGVRERCIGSLLLFCFFQILSKWKPLRRSNSWKLHCNCMENVYQPFRSHSGIGKVGKHHHNKGEWWLQAWELDSVRHPLLMIQLSPLKEKEEQFEKSVILISAVLMETRGTFLHPQTISGASHKNSLAALS